MIKCSFWFGHIYSELALKPFSKLPRLNTVKAKQHDVNYSANSKYTTVSCVIQALLIIKVTVVIEQCCQCNAKVMCDSSAIERLEGRPNLTNRFLICVLEFLYYNTHISLPSCDILTEVRKGGLCISPSLWHFQKVSREIPTSCLKNRKDNQPVRSLHTKKKRRGRDGGEERPPKRGALYHQESRVHFDW